MLRVHHNRIAGLALAGLLGALVLAAWAALFIPEPSISEPPDPLIAKFECPDRVNDVVFSPDGKLLAAAYGWHGKGGVNIWDVATKAVVTTLTHGEGNRRDVEKVAFSPDGKLLASVNFDGDVTLWATGSWRRLRTVIFRGGSPNSLEFSADGTRLAFSSDIAVFLHDLRSRTTVKIAARRNQSDYISGASFSPDGESLAICRRGGIQFWRLAAKKPTKRWPQKESGFFCRFSADGKQLIAGGGSVLGTKAVVVWDVNAERKLHELAEFRQGVFSLAISHSSRMFALGGGNYGPGGDLSLWDMRDGKEVAFRSVGRFPIDGLAFSPDDALLAAASADGVALVYRVDQLRGPHRTKQDMPLCGEVMAEGGQLFVVPLSRVPPPMRPEFDYAWKLPLVDGNDLAKLSGYPVILTEWEIERSAETDAARVGQFSPLLSFSESGDALRNYAIFGDISNPGWNEGFIAKVYGNGTFVASTNLGACLAYGSLSDGQEQQGLQAIRQRLLERGFLQIPTEPVTFATDHYRTRFIELSIDGVRHLRTDAEVIDFRKKDRPNTKKDFIRTFEEERMFISSLLGSGKQTPPH